MLTWIGISAQLSGNVVRRGRSEDINVQRRLTPDHLYRLGQILPIGGSAQNIMAIDDVLQGIQKGIKVFVAIESQQALQQIIIALCLQQMMEQNTLLQRCQWINILHIAGSTGDRLGDGIDLSLGQRNERQHFRGDGGAICGDKIVWHCASIRVILIGQHGLRQFTQDRGSEHTAHIQPPAERVELFNQADDHQRMSTQLKEMIMAADVLQSQQILPDLGQSNFHFPDRCGIAACDDSR
ncbi:hypothetical protein Xbed_03482 [Xenorhabdus beddingii]|uniref:Uncharacterized protein n=1 Tax=Xenorhabdus beddingii TaxID=40578 RepID=A0A1Y2SFJ4_9GAMM|nr:hypothetical protein Xbed_03482 [Xenorhabdus beddingii]